MDKMKASKNVVDNIKSLLERKLFILAQEQAIIGLEEDPNNVDILITLAQVYYECQDYLAAAEACEKAIKIAPDEPEFMRLAGLAWSQAGIVDRGIELANRQLISIQPKKRRSFSWLYSHCYLFVEKFWQGIPNNTF